MRPTASKPISGPRSDQNMDCFENSKDPPDMFRPQSYQRLQHDRDVRCVVGQGGDPRSWPHLQLPRYEA
ncbi:Putative apoptosis-inducing factor 1 mitochondrial [Caligus rogercresseyi]|uniref:Apoptosis-inducing factor 1 mitochondrial n=1 Tax=Caligus rogercresseyi TaxID=217165 RepID=A0A7T8KJ42_CALRO|nr:Putative apoptosis-inducing factor 1 mitochondrial [Caligus rogercresseyi]